MKRLLFTLCLFCMPVLAYADEAALTRREGFMQLWNSIYRNIYNYRDIPFADVHEGSEGYKAITYAKTRGLLSDTAFFYPEEPLTLEHALIMLFRLENVTSDPEDVSSNTLPSILEKYPVAYLTDEHASSTVSREDLQKIIERLNQLLAQEPHEVSLYAEKFHGKSTAFGDTFNMYDFTAAHKTYPANTLVKVTNISNGKSVIVRINDRGPFVPGRDMDLSLAAFTAIEQRTKGKFMATFERLGDHDLVDRVAGPLDGTMVDETYVKLLPDGTVVPSGSVQTAVAAVHDNVPADETSMETDGQTQAADAATCVPLSDRFMQRIGKMVLREGVPHQLKLGASITLSGPSAFVVRSVSFPDGTASTMQNWILPGEEFTLRPSIQGSYTFRIDDAAGRGREVAMEVKKCQE